MFKFTTILIDNPWLCGVIIKSFYKLITMLEYDKVKPILYNCLDNLRNNKAVVESFKIFKIIMQMYFESNKSSSWQSINSITLDGHTQFESEKINEEIKDEVSSKNLIDLLIEKEDLVEVLLNNLDNYCKAVQTILQKTWKNIEAIKHVFVGNFDHQTTIKTYLDFLAYLVAHSSYKISFNELSRICKLLIDASQIKYDKEAFLKWI